MLVKPLRLFLSLVVLMVLSACSHGGHDASPYSGMADAGDKPIPNVDPCETPNKGCVCDTPDQVVDCGQVERISGDYVSCTMGKRTCEAGTWGDCVGDRVATLSVPAGGRRTQALGSSQACIDNPCDPYCQRFVDNTLWLVLPDGGPFGIDAGLVLTANLPLPAGSCTGLVMTPATQNISVTAVNSAYVKGEYFNRFDK